MAAAERFEAVELVDPVERFDEVPLVPVEPLFEEVLVELEVFAEPVGFAVLDLVVLVVPEDFGVADAFAVPADFVVSDDVVEPDALPVAADLPVPPDVPVLADFPVLAVFTVPVDFVEPVLFAADAPFEDLELLEDPVLVEEPADGAASVPVAAVLLDALSSSVLVAPEVLAEVEREEARLDVPAAPRPAVRPRRSAAARAIPTARSRAPSAPRCGASSETFSPEKNMSTGRELAGDEPPSG